MRTITGLKARTYWSRSFGVMPPHTPLRLPLACSYGSSDLRQSIFTGQSWHIILASSQMSPFFWSPSTSGKNMFASIPLQDAWCVQCVTSFSFLCSALRPNGRHTHNFSLCHAPIVSRRGLLSRSGRTHAVQGTGLSSGKGFLHTVGEWFSSQSAFSSGDAYRRMMWIHGSPPSSNSWSSSGVVGMPSWVWHRGGVTHPCRSPISTQTSNGICSGSDIRRTRPLIPLLR